MIKLRNVTKSYDSRYTGIQRVFNDLSIDFPSKGLVSIFGKSGCGKTTLLNIIGGIDSVEKGSIDSFSYLISGYKSNNKNLDEYRKDIVGFVFQSYNLINNISVYKNLALPLEMQGFNKEVVNKKINEVIAKVEMIEYKNRMPYELSGGQQQRVAIARALIKKSKVVLADEPTGNLDSTNANEILRLLKDISKDRLVILITHDEEEAIKYSDICYKMIDGNIINDDKAIYKENYEIIKKKTKKVSIKTLVGQTLSNFKLNIVKISVLILLFSVSISVISNAIVVLNTSNADILKEVVTSDNDRVITPITYGREFETSKGEYAIDGYFNLDNIYNYYETVLDVQEKFGYDNVLLSTYVSIINDIDSSTIFNEFFYLSGSTRLNLLEDDVTYDFINLVGDYPKNNKEVIITDFISYLLFGTEDGIGETIKINRYSNKNNIIEIELIVVGIQQTDYLINGHIDQDLLLEIGNHNGETSVGNRYYNYFEKHYYSELYCLESVLEDLDTSHVYVGSNASIPPLSLTSSTHEGPIFIQSEMYSKDIAVPSTVIGRLPETNNEISIDLEQLKFILPNDELNIDLLINGDISWEYFKDLVELDEINVSFSNSIIFNQYSSIIPNTLIIVGVFEYDTEKVLFYRYFPVVYNTQLIKDLNNAYPYNLLGFSFVTSSLELINELEYITSAEFRNLLEDPPIFTGKVIVNTLGSFYLYRTLDTVNERIIPRVNIVLYGVLGFTFMFMFLYSYLSMINDKRRIGIFRSLGFRRSDIFKMYIIENIIVLLISIFLGLLLGNYLLDEVNEIIMIKTLTPNLHVYLLDSLSFIIIVIFSTILLVISLFPPLLKILTFSPIDIINSN